MTSGIRVSPIVQAAEQAAHAKGQRLAAKSKVTEQAVSRPRRDFRITEWRPRIVNTTDRAEEER